MSRLFITERELDFISDITKEIIKDVIGQKVFYYRVRDDLTQVHDVYNEAQEKIFDPPLEVDALVEPGGHTHIFTRREIYGGAIDDQGLQQLKFTKAIH